MKQFVNARDTSFDLSKSRHEVRQLGIKGLSNESKEDALVNKLVQLGAKVHCVLCTCIVLNITFYNNFWYKYLLHCVQMSECNVCYTNVQKKFFRFR